MTKKMSDRKSEHLALSKSSQVAVGDTRFFYEPLLSAHPTDLKNLATKFGAWQLGAPLWISSMTGGARGKNAKKINQNLAQVAGKYNLAMGLGSCRPILESNEFLADFKMKKYLGKSPLFGNLGIHQVAEFLRDKKEQKIFEMLKKIEADGLIVHVNPLQEWIQPEGDRYFESPLLTLEKLLNKITVPLIVKEVGQGFGPSSLAALLQMPLLAIDLAGFGGTNFSQLEILRQKKINGAQLPMVKVGQTCAEMIVHVHEFKAKNPQQILAKHLIFSGGMRDYLDGYFLLEQSALPSLYGQAQGLLEHAVISSESLAEYVEGQLQGLAMAKSFLRVRN